MYELAEDTLIFSFADTKMIGILEQNLFGSTLMYYDYQALKNNKKPIPV